MPSVLFHKLSLVFLLLFIAISAHATQILVLHNQFVSDQKFDKLAMLAQQQHIVLEHHNTSKNLDSLGLAIQSADLVVLDTPRPSDREEVIQKALTLLQQQQKKYLIIGGGTAEINGLEPTLGQRLIQLYGNGGAINFNHFFQVMQQFPDGSPMDLPEVEKLPDIAIYHPKAQQYFSKPADYLKWHQQNITTQTKSHAVFIVHPSTITDLTTEKIDELIQQAQQKQILPMVVLWNEAKSQISLADFLAEMPVDALVNMSHIQQGQKLVESLEKIDVPIIQTMRFSQDYMQWQHAQSGISPSLAATFLAVPETWGFSDPLVLSIQENGQDIWLKPQLNLLLDKINAQAQLKQLSNADKQLALMYWNYPSGANNLSASNLNVPLSIINIQKALTAEGYQIPVLNETQIIQQAQILLSVFYDHTKLSALQQQDLVGYYPVKEYLKWRSTLPLARQQQLPQAEQLQQHWSVVKKEHEYFFAIPRWQVGHLTILPQPPRGNKIGENYHSLESTPDVLYIATYLYLQQYQHALIHLGTHGTQEWLPGKDRGLDHADYPYLTAGHLPIFYPYVQDNIAEALQAKRRGRAVIISHQTAPLAPSGLYDELRDIHEIIHQYIQLDEGAVKQQTQQKLITLVQKSGIDKDLGISTKQIQQDFPLFFQQLHDHLHALAEKNVPLGLHHFGQSASDEQRIMIVMQQLGHGYLHALHQNHDELLAADPENIKQSIAYRWLAFHLLKQPDAEIAKLTQTPALQKYLTQAQQNFHNLAAEEELQSLSRALQGGFVLPGSGGDPIRQPESVSGRNLYAFEASKVPSKSAYETGGQTFEQLLEQYQQRHHGQLPKKIAFSLWSSETIRHLGVTEAQILHAIGAKPIWDNAGRVVKLEIIPRQQLTHPRIDVVIQATSVYRDQFDQFMRLLAQAFTEISALEEADNQLYLQAQQLHTTLIKQNIPEEQAKILSSLKIFSNRPGEYGSGLSKQTLAYDQWDNEQQLANTFLNNLQYAYGDKPWGETSNINLFAENLKSVDVALMSRSSNVQGVLSTDHPFEYLGGLSLAIRKLQGKSPELLITDLRQNSSEITTLKQFLSDEMRTRYLSPQWIKSMQKEGYAGTLQVLEATNNLYGWNVTDPDVVRDDQWQDLYETYVLDKRNLGVKKWFAQNNPQAQLQLLTRIAEAIRQDYWQADPQTRQQLAQEIKQLQQNPELTLESKHIQQFINQQLMADKNSETTDPTNRSSIKAESPNTPQSDKKNLSSPSSTPNQQRELTAKVTKGQGLDSKLSRRNNSSALSTPTPATVSNSAVQQKVQGQTLALLKPKQPPQQHQWLGALIVLGLIGFGMALSLLHYRKH